MALVGHNVTYRRVNRLVGKKVVKKVTQETLRGGYSRRIRD